MDITALKTEIEKARYSTAVTAGSVTDLLLLLADETDAGATTVFRHDVTLDEYEDVTNSAPELYITDATELTAYREFLLRRTSERQPLDFRRARVRKVLSNRETGTHTSTSWPTATIRAAVKRPQTYSDTIDGVGEVASHGELHAAMLLIPTSGPAVEASSTVQNAKAARSVLINAGGAKIGLLRAKMVGEGRADDFRTWRQTVYAIQGVDQDDTDALRTTEINAKAVTEGV